jgi:hypothetical protein
MGDSFLEDIVSCCSDKLLEKTFIIDLERPCYYEDSFQWPLEDPHHCLLFGLFAISAKLSERIRARRMTLQKIS